MKFNIVKNVFINELAKAYGCKTIYGIALLFVPGVNNLISNTYILYVYNFNTKHVDYIVLRHKPRYVDVINLLKKLSFPKDSLVLYSYNHPFTLSSVTEYIRSFFKHSIKFESRSLLGEMYLFHSYLNSVINVNIKGYKTRVAALNNGSSKVKFEFPEEWISYIIDKFNNGDLSEMVNSYPLPSNRGLEDFKSLIEDREYQFNVEVASDLAYGVKLHLFPTGSYSVNNKLFESIYSIMHTTKEIINLKGPKTLIVNIRASDEQWFTVGRSLIFSEDISLRAFNQNYVGSILKLKNRAYPLDNIDYVGLTIIKHEAKTTSKKINNKPQARSYSTIRKLAERTKSSQNIGVLDIETIFYNGVHLPYAIGYHLKGQSAVIYYVSDFGKSLKPSSQKMMDAFLIDFLKEAKGSYIYCHNLGSFDGYLLLKDLHKHCDKLDILMDKQRKFISIEVNPSKTKLRDSLRILPASLENLGSLFKADVKKSFMDHNKVNKTLIYTDDFKVELKDYLKTDLMSLLEVITKADDYLLNQYNIDLSKCFSASSMAMKIYRTKFIATDIPILPLNIENEIRESYRGGHTEVYRCVGHNLYHYDMNSLYAYAIMNPMPFQFKLITHDIDLNNFFGFATVNVFAPDTIFNPFLPYKDIETGNLHYPYGFFKGTYFSEELKAAKAKGYEFEILIGYEFSKKNLFDDYVTHFYEKKANSSGGIRFLYKLMLNSLYGYLGRESEQLKTDIIQKNKLSDIVLEYYIYDLIDLDDKNVLITRDEYPSRKLQKINNITPDYNTNYPKLMNNVAIASAITSYARMMMVPIKTNKENPPLYTDTDSVFLSKPLPSHLVGPELGQFKQELDGHIISEALFLAPKMYGFKYDNKEKVVISGVKPDSVSYNELISIWKGNTITKDKNMIVKNYKDLSIRSKKISLDLSLNFTDSPKHLFLIKMVN